ncbi:12187_t:CDS:2, partial [Funneliformis caledonium]
MNNAIKFKRANSESLASKSRRNSNKENENLKGKKPDFKLVMNVVDEILFGEVKPPKSKNSTLLLNKDLVKLANFQAGSLDELIKKYGNRTGLASFGIWICGERIYIYDMDLNYDGIYKMTLTSNLIVPTSQTQFVSLIPVLEAFYNIKDRISNVLEITHDNLLDSTSRSMYGRKPTSSPKPVKIPIIGLQPKK